MQSIRPDVRGNQVTAELQRVEEYTVIGDQRTESDMQLLASTIEEVFTTYVP
jgi:hypothetical protein